MAARSSVAVSVTLAVLMTCFVLPSGAEDAQTDSEAGDSKPAGHGTPVGALSSDIQDPGNLLPGIRIALSPDLHSEPAPVARWPLW